MQSLINYESHLITTCTLGSITGKNILVQTSKAWANGKLHMRFRRLRESVTVLKDDTPILYRQTRVSQITLQLRELGVRIFPTRCPACNNMVRLFGEYRQIKAVTKTEDHKVGKVQTVAGLCLMSSDASGITDWYFLWASFPHL